MLGSALVVVNADPWHLCFAEDDLRYPLVTHRGIALAAKWQWNLPRFATTR